MRASIKRARRKCAHPAGIRTLVIVEDPLVILRGADRQRADAVADDEERDLGPGRHSSITSRWPAAPNRCSVIAASIAASASSRSVAITTPLPAARPSALRTTGNPNAAAANDCERVVARCRRSRNRAVGTSCRAMNAFAKALLDSSASGAPGSDRTAARSSAAKRSATPSAQRHFRSDDGEIDLFGVGECRARSSGLRRFDRAAVRASSAIPGLPGAQTISWPTRDRRAAGRRARALWLRRR